MAFPFPADKLVAVPAAGSAEKEAPRKSKSRKARRAAKDEARLFQSCTMVDMEDWEENDEGSQSTKKPRKKRGDTTWRKFSSLESSSNESGVMVGYSSASSSLSSTDSSMAEAMGKIRLSPESVAVGA